MNLSRNEVNKIEKHSFNDITSVYVLDLSFNMLNYIVKHSIDEIDTIGILLLVGNVFENVQVVNFVHFFRIDNTGFCCIMNTKYCSSDSQSGPPVHGVLSHNNYSFKRSENNYYSLSAKEKFHGDTHCRYMIKYSTVRYLFWGMLALCISVNALFLFVKIVPHNKSELRIFNFNIFLFDFLKALFILFLLIFDSRYKTTFSFAYLQWRKSLSCLFLRNIYFVARQMILHTILGNVLFSFYVVSPISVLKLGERSRNVFTFQLFGNILWPAISVTGHVPTHGDSDLCLSLTSGMSSDVYVRLFIILSFVFNAVIYCFVFPFAFIIVLKVAEVEKQANKKREKKFNTKTVPCHSSELSLWICHRCHFCEHDYESLCCKL